MRIYFLGAILLLCANLLCQSSSVFDACYFKRDNTEPPLKAGKGFHINDVYKQTQYCFTPASCSSARLKAQETSQKTNISLYYTQNDEQFNNLRNIGTSGKISFLNMFSVGSQNLETFSSKTFQNTERLVLVAKVDFGVYSFDNNLTLSPEAKTLITQNKTTEFIEAYGTHYISGVRKENSIWIILTKTSSGSANNQYTSSKSEFGVNIPYKAKGSFEISEGSETESLLNSSGFVVSVEISGPPLKEDLIKRIQEIINSKEENKLASIKDLLSSAATNISNPAQSKISQYYYTPFTLKGLKGVYWDERKQNQLIKINEYAAQIYTIKSQIEPLASFNGQSIISKEFDTSVSEYSKKKERKTELFVTYKEQQPVLKTYKLKLDTFLLLLEKNYTSCSDIFCNNTNCCNEGAYQDAMQEVLFNAKENIDKLELLIKTAASEAYEENTPACQKENVSVVTIINKSVNPYDLYNGDKFMKVLQGGSENSFNVKPGTYNFKAIQKSGFLMYATQNKRQAIITKPCEQLTLNIGFED